MKKLFLYTEIGCLLLATSCSNTPHTAETGRYNTMTMTAESRTLNQNYTAVITGRQCVEIRPQVSGTITEVCIEEGAKVTKGQTLFIIDQVPYKAALQTAVANVKSAEAAVATARMTASSKEELFNEHVVSAFDLQTARNQLLEAEAALEQAQAAEISARNDLSYTEVKSPVNGVASMIPYRVGALVDASITTPLATVSDDGEMYVYFSMTENQVLSLIRENGTLEEAMKQMPEVELRLSDGLMYAHKGKIDAMSGTIDTGTGSVSLRATFPNPERMLRNGGSGTVVFPYQMDNVLVVPQEATYEIQDKIFVYRVTDGKATSTPVTVFPVDNGKEYIIEQGLKAGDVIVAEGAGLLQEGTLIESGHEKT
ncbi:MULTISPECIES: efflux RND transporter periplasmic adaptor subunit [Bacteroides]|uniref:Efflux RND transporter periplasmic adaptor subunit n=2 Tax=Bacteroidaceae TaxID=815 RepID=A0ABT7VEW1_9BACE|nr:MULTISPECIES: efflux RND transporter periplasmic adaptor subunit [Bacteroides]MBU3856780.1 efflux RND transporter periplasmic adaptor subunit [Candidatus Phocaeicola excrementipullorum]MCR8917218.1 efflux RND transporter periplasmic adaptor subunit [Bacteroides sp. ET225]MDM8324832.1 efflux RND transporter periplasmic adaptor subunit [Bacteroides gallinaceum]